MSINSIFNRTISRKKLSSKSNAQTNYQKRSASLQPFYGKTCSGDPSEEIMRTLHLKAPSHRTKKMNRLASLSLVTMLVVVIGAIAAGLAWQNGRFASAEGSDSASALPSGTDGKAPTLGTPSEARPEQGHNQFSETVVGFDKPANLVIKKLHVDAPIYGLGASSDNRLMFPGNIYDIGWFSKSGLPGGNAAMLLDAHAAGPTKHGALYNAGELNNGDEIEVIRGDNVRFSYHVTGREVFYNQRDEYSGLLSRTGKSDHSLYLVVNQASVGTQEVNYKQAVVLTAQLD